jgi:hypothetical protein
VPLTFLEMQDEVLDMIDASSLEERARVKRRINDVYGQVVATILTPIKSVGPVTLTGTGDYDLTAAPFSLTDFVSIRTVIYNQSGGGTNYTLDHVTPGEIYAARNQIWTGFLYAFALQGTSTLMLVPNPSAGDTLTLVYDYRPAPMASDSDTPLLLADEDVDTIIVGAAWRMSRLKAPARAMALEQDFQRRMDAAQASQNRRGGTAGLLRRGNRRRPPHDNSTDIRGGNRGY